MDRKSYMDFVESTSEDFFRFMNMSYDINDVNIRYDDYLQDCGQHVKKDNEHFIVLNQSNLEAYSDHGEGVIFHELTHYIDHEYFLSMQSDECRKFQGLYTEFHATYIQMMKWCGFRSAEDAITVLPFQLIPGIGNEIKITDFYVQEYLLAKNLIESHVGDYSCEAIEKLLKRALYFGAEFWFSKQFINLNFEKVIDFSIFRARFGQPIITIIQHFMTNKPIDNAMINTVSEAYDAITKNEAANRVFVKHN